MKRKRKKNKDFNKNQTSFYFEDYLETNQKSKKVKNSNISQDRVYLLFFLFFSIILVLFLTNEVIPNRIEKIKNNDINFILDI